MLHNDRKIYVQKIYLCFVQLVLPPLTIEIENLLLIQNKIIIQYKEIYN